MDGSHWPLPYPGEPIEHTSFDLCDKWPITTPITLIRPGYDPLLNCPNILIKDLLTEVIIWG